MTERKFSVLRNTWDFYRTAPFGETQAIVFAGLLLGSGSEADWFTLGISGFNIAGGIFLTAAQFRLRERLENSIKQFGYDDRVFSVYLNKWCDRQTCKVVTERAGYQDDYLNLYNLQKRQLGFWSLRSIPHF